MPSENLFASLRTLAASVLISAGALAQQAPGPNDEAQLYEVAKKEGKVVWYEGAPLEPMQAIALEFEKKYPGIKVEVLRIVGVQQYQRFMQETCRRSSTTSTCCRSATSRAW